MKTVLKRLIGALLVCIMLLCELPASVLAIGEGAAEAPAAGGTGADESRASGSTRNNAAVSLRMYTDDYPSLDGNIAALVPAGNGYSVVEAEYDSDTGFYVMELPIGGVYPLACAAYGGIFIDNSYNSAFYMALTEIDLSDGGSTTVEVKMDEGRSLSQFHAQSTPETIEDDYMIMVKGIAFSPFEEHPDYFISTPENEIGQSGYLVTRGLSETDLKVKVQQFYGKDSRLLSNVLISEDLSAGTEFYVGPVYSVEAGLESAFIYGGSDVNVSVSLLDPFGNTVADALGYSMEDWQMTEPYAAHYGISVYDENDSHIYSYSQDNPDFVIPSSSLPIGNYYITSYFEIEGAELYLLGDPADFTVSGAPMWLTAPSEAFFSAQLTVHGPEGAEAQITAHSPSGISFVYEPLTIPEGGVCVMTVTLNEDGTWTFTGIGTIDGSPFAIDAITVHCAIAAPENVVLTASPVTNALGTSIRLTWSGVSANTAALRLYRDGELIAEPGLNQTEYLDSGLTNGRIYTYHMIAVSAAGTESSPVYASAMASNVTDTTAPTVPNGLTAEATGTTVTLRWERSYDDFRVAGYRVYRGEQLVADIPEGHRECVDTGLMPGTEYGYSVSAYDDFNNESARSAAVSVATLNIQGAFESVSLTVSKNPYGGAADDTLWIEIIAAPSVTGISAEMTCDGTDGASFTHSFTGYYNALTSKWYVLCSLENAAAVTAISVTAYENESELGVFSAFEELPLVVCGSANIEFTLPNAMYATHFLAEKARLVLVSGSYHVVASKPIVQENDTAEYLFDGLSAGEYNLKMMIASRSFELGSFTVTAGETTEYEVTASEVGLFRIYTGETSIAYWPNHIPFEGGSWSVEYGFYTYGGDSAFYLGGSRLYMKTSGGIFVSHDMCYRMTDFNASFDLNAARESEDYELHVVYGENGFGTLLGPARTVNIHCSVPSGRSIEGLGVTTQISYSSNSETFVSLVPLDENGDMSVSFPDMAGGQLRVEIPAVTIEYENGGSFTTVGSFYYYQLAEIQNDIQLEITEMTEVDVTFDFIFSQQIAGSVFSELTGYVNNALSDYIPFSTEDLSTTVSLRAVYGSSYSIHIEECWLTAYCRVPIQNISVPVGQTHYTVTVEVIRYEEGMIELTLQNSNGISLKGITWGIKEYGSSSTIQTEGSITSITMIGLHLTIRIPEQYISNGTGYVPEREYTISGVPHVYDPAATPDPNQSSEPQKVGKFEVPIYSTLRLRFPEIDGDMTCVVFRSDRDEPVMAFPVTESEKLVSLDQTITPSSGVRVMAVLIPRELSDDEIALLPESEVWFSAGLPNAVIIDGFGVGGNNTADLQNVSFAPVGTVDIVTDLTGAEMPAGSYSIVYHVGNQMLFAVESNEILPHGSSCEVSLAARNAVDFDNFGEYYGDERLFVPLSEGGNAVQFGFQREYLFLIHKGEGMESYPLLSFLVNYHDSYISNHGVGKRDYAVLDEDYREIRDENGEPVSDCELVRVVTVKDPGSAKNEGVYVVFALNGDLPLYAGEDIRRWIDEPDALCTEIDIFTASPLVERTLDYPVYQVIDRDTLSVKTVDVIEAEELTISLEANLLYPIAYSIFFKLPDGAHDVSVNGVPTTLTDGGFIGECPFTVTFEIPSELLADHSFVEIYIITPQGRKSWQARRTIDYKVFEFGVQQNISTNEVIFHDPNLQHFGQPVYAIELNDSNSRTQNNIFHGGINTVGGFSWVTTMYKGGMEDGGITLMPSPVDHDYDEYRIHHGMKWEGSWISFESSLGEFEIGLRVDGVPVSYLVQKHVLMEDVSYSSSGSGSGSSSTNVTGSSFSVIPRFEETAAAAQSSVFDGIFGASGRYETQEDGSLIYWLSSDWLKLAGLFSAGEDMGFLFVPLCEPETYPHAFNIELFFRYDEAGESKVLERGTSVTLRLDAPIMYKFTVDCLECYNVPNQDREMTVYTNIRSSAERDRALNSSNGFILSYAPEDARNLFTVKAYFDKPKEVANVYAVGDVPDDCPYYRFPLHYDESLDCWVGTGVLGEIMRSVTDELTDGFNVVYEYVSDQLDENGYPALQLNELEYARNSMSVNGYSSVPEGYGVSELAPENGWTLSETYEKWQTFFGVLSNTSYYDLTDAQIRSFTDENYRLYAPAAGLYNDEGVLLKVKQLYFAFTEEEYGEQAAEMTFNILDGAELNNQMLMGLTYGGDEWKLSYHVSDPGALLSLLTGCDNVPSRSGGTRWANAIKWTFTAAEKCADVAGGVGSLNTVADAINKPDWYQDLPEEGKELYDSYNTANTILTGVETVLGFIPHTGIPVFLLDNYLFGNYRDEINENLKNMALSSRARKNLRESNPNSPGVQHATIRKDPSGYVFEGYDDNRTEGVTATIYQYTGNISGWVFDDNGVLVSGTPDGTLWEKWDSEAYDEGPNPNITDENGAYGWDVPTGAWKVVFEKDGCFVAESVVLGVPPEHLDVNISLLSYEPAELKAVTAYTSCIEFEFTKPVRVDDVFSKVSVLYNGVALFGTIEAINEGVTAFGNKQAESENMTEAGLAVATRFRFMPNDPGDLIPGSTVRVSGEAGILTYSYLEMADLLSDYVLIPESDGNGGDPIRELNYSGPDSMETAGTLNLAGYLEYVGTDGSLTYEALTPDIAALSGTTVVPVAAGMAIFAVSANGETLPIVIEITETKVLYTVSVSAGGGLTVSKPMVSVLAGEAMEVIHVTAPDGYMIPEDFTHEPVNGVHAERVSYREIAVYGVPEANAEINISVEPEEIDVHPTVGYVRAELRERPAQDGRIDVRLIFEADMDGAKYRVDLPNGGLIWYGNENSIVEILDMQVDIQTSEGNQVAVPIVNLFNIDGDTITFTVVIVGMSKAEERELTLTPAIRYSFGRYAPEPYVVRIGYDFLMNGN